MTTAPTAGYARGTIILHREDGKSEDTIFVRRIVGLPGETVAMRSGTVVIDGMAARTKPTGAPPIRTPYGDPLTVHSEVLPGNVRHLIAKGGPGGPGDDVVPTKVPPDHYWMLGDSRSNALDSRFPPPDGPGFIAARNIVGRLGIVVLSPETWRIGLRPA